MTSDDNTERKKREECRKLKRESKIAITSCTVKARNAFWTINKQDGKSAADWRPNIGHGSVPLHRHLVAATHTHELITTLKQFFVFKSQL